MTSESVYFQWAAGIPNLAILLQAKYPPEPIVMKGSRSEVTLPIIL